MQIKKHLEWRAPEGETGSIGTKGSWVTMQFKPFDESFLCHLDATTARDIAVALLHAAAEADGYRGRPKNADLTLDEYQEFAQSTLGDSDLRILALGLCGEAGEVADVVKKHKGHGHDLDEDKIVDELGDVLWYVAMMALAVNDIDLSAIAHENMQKLRARYPDGFSEERSRNR